MSIPEGLLTVEQARERLGVSRQKMAQFLKDGSLPHMRFMTDRRKKYIRVEDVDRMAAELVTPISEEGKRRPAEAA